MNSHLWAGLALLGVGMILMLIARPNKAGESPRFLRFDAALVLFPPVVLVFVALGLAMLISAV